MSSGQTFKITACSGISLGSDLQNAECEPQTFLSIGEWEIMCCASGKFSAALKSSRGQCLLVDLSKWQLVYFGAVEAPLPLVLLGSGRFSFIDTVWYKTQTFDITKELL